MLVSQAGSVGPARSISYVRYQNIYFLAKSIPWVYASEWAIEMKAVIKDPTTCLHVRGKQGHFFIKVITNYFYY